MRLFVGMVLCALGVIALVISDALVNWSAAAVVGSSPESVKSAKMVAIGVVVAGMALGSILHVVNNKAGQAGVCLLICMVGLVSATFTVQGVSIDYAANDHSGRIQGARQGANKLTIKTLQDTKRALESDLDDKKAKCKKFERYRNCNETESKIAEMATRIEAAAKDNVASVMAEEIDISEAVYEKSGIPGHWVEMAAIWSRAFAIPPVISILTFGFWGFWGEWREKGKKPLGGSQSNGSALASFLENLMNGKPKEVSKPKPSNDLVPGMSDSIAKEYFPHLLDENVVDIKSGKSTPKTTPETTPKKKHTSKQTSPKPRGSKDRGGSVVGEVRLPRNIDKTITDKEVRYKLVEYLVRREVIKPTYAQIGRLGIGSDYVKHYVEKLDKNGIIKRGGKGSRSVVYDHKKLGEHQKIAKYETLIKRAA